MKQVVISVQCSHTTESWTGARTYTHMANRGNHLAADQYRHMCVGEFLYDHVCDHVCSKQSWQFRSEITVCKWTKWWIGVLLLWALFVPTIHSCTCACVFGVCLFLSMWEPVMPVLWRVLTQSMMRILLTLSLLWSCLAAMATELKKQKPLWTNRGEGRQPRVYQDIFHKPRQNHQMDLRNL